MLRQHPKGLYLLFATEMWERFSYYGMRALFVLFMVNALMYDKVQASEIYGSFTGLVYFAPLLGGYISDRFWGNRRSIVVGALLMAAGQFAMFTSGLFHTNAALATPWLYGGLGLLIAGNGLFKPNISSMVGQLYPVGDKRIDSAFTIFYMGINAGALLAPLVCGTLGDTGNPDDFKWGFLAAGTGMLISLCLFLFFKDKHLVTPEGKAIGMAPVSKLDASGKAIKHEPLTHIEKQRLAVIMILAAFVIFFWSAFEQAGASLTFFAAEQTNRNVLGFTIPASYFQSINPISIVLFAPVFAWLWTKLGNHGVEPNSPMKMAIGLLFLALGYLVIAFGVSGVTPDTKVSMMWLVSLYMLHTFGELCLSPIGLSLVVKLSPARLTSLMMGIWFVSNAAANKFAGMLSELYPEPGKPVPQLLGYAVNNLHDFFMLFVFMAGTAALILFALSSTLKKMMHGLS
ncbi:peptide MFS transporter [Craterilacuibacter sp. RT1T]|uniref:peptide MFS transporter n=1 Tax=Craterilacuibacter sp. RT1T TaxID=2942211 RepID=UPI0020C0E62E|nr:peptide MFS transporter [Craterilacuibacter sp. RT1T]MCL6263794.1 peptide MFS transporter [Craterilacuibacter sp. RT1T]